MKFSTSRRAFLGSALGGLATASLVRGQDPISELAQKFVDDAAFQPSTLFLTWQRDPTTTMTVQWVGTQGETSDTKIYYSAGFSLLPSARASVAKPFGQTDLKVFRAELTGLTPGTDYQFKI